MIDQFKSLNIGIACQALKQSGGMERYVLDLIDVLHELGIRPTVFARKFDKELTQYQWVEAVRVNVNWLPSKCRDYWFSRQMPKLKEENKIDILLSTSRISCADVAICGGTHKGFLQAMNRERNFWDKIQCQLEESFYKNAKVVVAHSKLMQQEIRDLYGINSSKIHCIYPPVNLERFDVLSSLEDKKKLRNRLGLPADKYLFVYPVGGDFKRKGMQILKDFFSKTDLPIELVIVGKEPKDYFPNMKYLGYCSDMKSLYQAVDFTIMASCYEPFGLIGPESVACGTRLVLSDRVACKEVLSESAFVTFDPLSIKSLEHSISSLLQKHPKLPVGLLTASEISQSLELLDNPKTHVTKILSHLK